MRFKEAGKVYAKFKLALLVHSRTPQSRAYNEFLICETSTQLAPLTKDELI